MSHQEMRFSGFGGQGIILAGHIMGRAATLHTDLNATLTQSYGPESRGGACAVALILSDEPIHYPHVIIPNVLIAMSQEAYNKYAGQVRPEGVILIDETLVDPEITSHEAPVQGVPATKIAEELGRSIVANIVMLGFVAGATDLLPEEAIRQAILNSVPKGTETLNGDAFSRGLEYAKSMRVEER